MANIEIFKSHLTGGGARANQFDILMTWPAAIIVEGNAQTELRYLCKATSLPSTTVGETPVPYRGRVLKLAGDRTYEDWETTILNDTDFNIRNTVEHWVDTMDRTLSEGDFSSTSSVINPMDYQSQAIVRQLDRTGKVIKLYQFHGIWPSNITAIDLGYDTNDVVEEFNVTWKYNYFTSHVPTTTFV